MASWDGTYEASPAGTDAANTLDTEIQSLKTEITQRMDHQHTTYLNDSTEGAVGSDFLHKKGSAVLYSQTTAPTVTVSAAQDGMLWWDSDDEALKIYVHATTSWLTIYQKDSIGTIKFWDTSVGGAWTDSTAGGSWLDGTMPGWAKFTEGYDQFLLMKATSGSTSDTNELSGGAVAVTVAEENLPAHVHTIAHTHFTVNTDSVSGGALGPTTTICQERETGIIDNNQYYLNGTLTPATIGITSASSAADSGSVGSDTDLDVTPPYYSLIPIIRRH